MTSHNSALTHRKTAMCPAYLVIRTDESDQLIRVWSPLTLRGKGGLEDRCPEQWCSASLNHDSLQGFQSNAQCSYIYNLE